MTAHGPGAVRVLVTGGRDYRDAKAVADALDTVRARYPTATIVHGAARGADRLADSCARALGLRVEAYPADWTRFGRAAGIIRNQRMLASGVDLVLAFPGGIGTADMVRRAQKAGVAVELIGSAVG